MKRTAEGTPFLSWAIIARNCEKSIEATLKSLRERTPEAEIVVVDTCSSDLTPEIACEYADVFESYTGPNGDWDKKMLAFDDAAAARNRSFELAQGKFVGWIDADDVIAGPEEVEKILKVSGRWHPTPNVRGTKNGKLKGLDESKPIGLEELLERISADYPEIVGFWAPYLYRRHKDGTAAEWQERERIVKNDGTWHWVGKGHEVLVQKAPKAGSKIGTLSSLLFVHMKEWNDGDFIHSVTRHYNALIKEYDAGKRDARSCWYLENFSRSICPMRRGEFLKAMYEASYTTLDRGRALIRLGQYSTENGFYFDATEAFAGAIALCPHLPDAWLAGAEAFERAKDYSRAAEWYERGLACTYNGLESLLVPRDLVIGYRVKAAACMREVARALTRNMQYEDGLRVATRAFELAKLALNDEAAGPDAPEILRTVNMLENEAFGYKHAIDLYAIWEYMRRNEENQKAAKLLDLVPHTIDDHPLVIHMRMQNRKVVKHLSDPKAYVEFYNSPETGAEFLDDLFEKPPLARVEFLIDWLKKEKPNARILEIGCFDGPVGIHVLRACPDVTYVAVDAMHEALVRFKARADDEGFGDRLSIHEGMDAADIPAIAGWKFDAVVFYEIIEHVPDPVASLERLRGRLRPGGGLFVSTPWGAYDRGRSHNADTRDSRGHVRAMTAWELVRDVEAAGFRVDEQGGLNSTWGATLHLRASPLAPLQRRAPVTFAVPSALWSWNATHVERTGIGASEETIVYLARQLARASSRHVAVFGPVPEEGPCTAEETREGVSYWNRTKFDRIDAAGPVIVSRAPSLGKALDEAAGAQLDKLLWLQDVGYPDLNSETAAQYRKIVCVSEWQAGFFTERNGVSPEKMVVIPNFLLADHFRFSSIAFAASKVADRVKREPFHFIYASSPDRGLIRLLKLWPKIRERWPEATLDIFYGWEGCMALGANDPAWNKRYRGVRTDYLGLQWQPGVTERGRVNHEQIAREFGRASVWFYPTDFAETFCTNAVKARAAGCVPVCTPFAGLLESAQCDFTRYVEMPGVGELEDPTAEPAAFEAYAERALFAIESALSIGEGDREAMSEQAIMKYRIESVMPAWEELLTR